MGNFAIFLLNFAVRTDGRVRFMIKGFEFDNSFTVFIKEIDNNNLFVTVMRFYSPITMNSYPLRLIYKFERALLCLTSLY